MVEVRCKCGAVYRADEKHVGGSLRCTNPACKAVLSIPQALFKPTTYHVTINTSPPARRKKAGARDWRALAPLLSVLATLAAGVAGGFLLNYFQNSEPQPEKPTNCVEGKIPERPTTGTRIKPDTGDEGRHTLLVRNGRRQDAVVRLYDSTGHESRRFFYVRAGESYKVSNVALGIYGVRFMSGVGWVPACLEFSQQPSYAQFRDSLNFVQVDLEGYEITLNPVPEGQAKVDSIGRRQFLEGDER